MIFEFLLFHTLDEPNTSSSLQTALKLISLFLYMHHWGYNVSDSKLDHIYAQNTRDKKEYAFIEWMAKGSVRLKSLKRVRREKIELIPFGLIRSLLVSLYRLNKPISIS